MKKYINYVLDILLLLSGLVSLFSSYVVWFILPRGVGVHGGIFCGNSGRGVTGNNQPFLGLFRFTWIEVHNWASVVLLIIILIHIILHWRWIVETTLRTSNYFQKNAIKVLELYGTVVTLSILYVFECLSGFVIWLVMPRGTLDYNQMIGGLGRTFLGLQRNVWVDLHSWVAIAIVSILIIHLILNWSWVVGVTKRIFRGTVREAA